MSKIKEYELILGKSQTFCSGRMVWVRGETYLIKLKIKISKIYLNLVGMQIKNYTICSLMFININLNEIEGRLRFACWENVKNVCLRN